MEGEKRRPRKGDIYYVPYPFTEKDNDDPDEDTKDRPAIILYRSAPSNFVMARITSGNSENAILLSRNNVEKCSLGYDASYVNPDIIATISPKLFRRYAGSVKPKKLEEIISKIKELLDDPDEEVKSPALARPPRQKRVR